MRELALRRMRLFLPVAVGVCLVGLPTSGATQDRFERVGNLVMARDGAQATLLSDGTVLVTGGNHQVGPDFGLTIAAAERFDPTTNQFTALPDMAVPRDDSERTVLLQDGRVLIVSGGSARLVESFDPTTNQFLLTGVMMRIRGGPSATLLPDGKVLIAGGFTNQPFGPSETAELFDPATGQSRPTGSLRVARYRHAAVALPDGRVVVLGGNDGRQAVGRAEIYDPQTGVFTPHGNLVEARSNLMAHLLPDGRILVVGGLVHDPETGEPIGARQSVEIYDPATGQSAIVDRMPDAAWYQGSAALPDGRILVVGGGDLSDGGKGPLRTAVLIDPKSGKVFPTASMTTERVWPAAVPLRDGRILIVGGANGDRSSLSTAEVFVPGPSEPAPR